MGHCAEFIQFHKNHVGSVGYCYGCERFHLKMKGLLSLVNHQQMQAIGENLKRISMEMETSKDVNDPSLSVQIKIAKDTYLCLSIDDVKNGLELIEIAHYMKNVNDLVL